MYPVETTASGPTVFIVDNDPSMRAALAWLMESVELAAETFATAEAFLDHYAPEQAGCLVLDLRLPGMSGVALQDELRRRAITLPVIMVSGFADVDTAVRVLRRGALDFIEKPFSDEALLERVREALLIDRHRRRDWAARQHVTARLACLTARERAVFDQVVLGKANKVVAFDLRISEKTVEAHRSRVMHKLGATSLAELVRMDLQAHPLPPSAQFTTPASERAVA